jgi:hypothetical protein
MMIMLKRGPLFLTTTGDVVLCVQDYAANKRTYRHFVAEFKDKKSLVFFFDNVACMWVERILCGSTGALA